MQKPLISLPPPLVWEVFANENIVQDESSFFLLLWVRIRQHEFRCFYVWRSTDKSSFTIDAYTSINASGAIRPPKDRMQHSTEIQSFGSLDGYNFGVIYVQRVSRPQQVLTLVITPSDTIQPSLVLHPLKQIGYEVRPDTRYGCGWDTRACLPTYLEIHGPVMHEQAMAFVNKSTGKNINDMQGIFILENNPEKVQVISCEDYLNIRKRTYQRKPLV